MGERTRDQYGVLIRMDVKHAKLSHQLVNLHDTLLRAGLFDEAHSLTVALEAPSLCDGEYLGAHLEHAAAVAVKHKLFEVATWITIILGRVRERSPEFAQPLCA